MNRRKFLRNALFGMLLFPTLALSGIDTLVIKRLDNMIQSVISSYMYEIKDAITINRVKHDIERVLQDAVYDELITKYRHVPNNTPDTNFELNFQYDVTVRETLNTYTITGKFN